MTVSNYGGLPKEFSGFDKSKIVILPVPYDKTSTWIKGADKGPQALIEASANMELYDIETDSEVYLKGIFTDKPVKENGSPEKMAQAVKERVNFLLNNSKFPVVVGGEHSVSIGAFQACKTVYTDMCVLQLDAHSDMRDEYHGSKYNHACVMKRAKDICPVVQVGIRSMDISEKQNIDRDRIFYAEEIQNSSKWMDKAISKLTNRVYITIDIDAFDISTMLATGTPEPGGMTWYQVLTFLKRVIQERDVIGFDLVELCPNKESRPFDFFAAKLIYKLLSYKFAPVVTE